MIEKKTKTNMQKKKNKVLNVIIIHNIGDSFIFVEGNVFS